MRVELLPSSFDASVASRRQHLTCFIIDGVVAVDAGSLAMAATPEQTENIRDIVLTHAHLDHIAGLPLFIDDLFSTLTEPIRIHATKSVIETLEQDIFNWRVYPRFSELTNEHGPVLAYRSFDEAEKFTVKHLTFQPAAVNHKVPASGFLISDLRSTIALSGDTAEMDGFWNVVNGSDEISALLLECAFPDELEDLARVSHHLTPSRLADELRKCEQSCPIYVINLKPRFRDAIVAQLSRLNGFKVVPLEVGRVYDL